MNSNTTIKCVTWITVIQKWICLHFFKIFSDVSGATHKPFRPSSHKSQLLFALQCNSSCNFCFILFSEIPVSHSFMHTSPTLLGLLLTVAEVWVRTLGIAVEKCESCVERGALPPLRLLWEFSFWSPHSLLLPQLGPKQSWCGCVWGGGRGIDTF